jgi:hypothetical protein
VVCCCYYYYVERGHGHAIWFLCCWALWVSPTVAWTTRKTFTNNPKPETAVLASTISTCRNRRYMSRETQKRKTRSMDCTVRRPQRTGTVCTDVFVERVACQQRPHAHYTSHPTRGQSYPDTRSEQNPVPPAEPTRGRSTVQTWEPRGAKPPLPTPTATHVPLPCATPASLRRRDAPASPSP